MRAIIKLQIEYKDKDYLLNHPGIGAIIGLPHVVGEVELVTDLVQHRKDDPSRLHYLSLDVLFQYCPWWVLKFEDQYCCYYKIQRSEPTCNEVTVMLLALKFPLECGNMSSLR